MPLNPAARHAVAIFACGCLLTGPVLLAQDTGDPIVSTETRIVDSARIDVVFVLDTTGSMGGLIEGAKQKIWAIANAIAMAEPTPEVRIGLVGYRDRGDQYVTKRVDLTEDLDLVYNELLSFAAGGGGDGPESVNQALHEAVTEMSWADGDETLKLVYLVGDAPPHMDYQDDVKYLDSCKIAAESGLIVNTIQCGSVGGTESIWREIASKAEGEYFAIQQSGGVTVVATPYDEELARLGTELTGSVVHYGDETELVAQFEKAVVCESIDGAASDSARAGRAVWNGCGYGAANLVGQQELLFDLDAGNVKLEDIPVDELPEEMQELTLEEREAWVQTRLKQRQGLQTRIQDLGRQRSQFLRENAGAGEDSFDRSVVDSLRRQAERVGLEYPEAGTDADTDTDAKTDTETDAGTDAETDTGTETDAGTDAGTDAKTGSSL